VEKALEEEPSIYIPDAWNAELPPALAAAIRSEGFRSILHLPLRDGVERLGTLVLYLTASGGTASRK
jgi:GAF domain-containing protein